MGETLQTLSLEIDLLQKKLKILKEIREEYEKIENLKNITIPGSPIVQPYYPQQGPYYPPTYPYPWNDIIYTKTTTTTNADPNEGYKYVKIDGWPEYYTEAAKYYPPEEYYGPSEEFIKQFEDNVD